MPSSHMTVIVAVAFFIFVKKDSNALAKLGMTVLCVLQGIARVLLHYHTFEQVFGGVIFGSVFAFSFFVFFDFIWPRVSRFVPSWLCIQDDLNAYTPIEQK
jgi:membrane-associated phospholipid phosphatase